MPPKREGRIVKLVPLSNPTGYFRCRYHDAAAHYRLVEQGRTRRYCCLKCAASWINRQNRAREQWAKLVRPKSPQT